MIDAKTIELDIVVTLDDQLRYTEWAIDRPALLWRRVAIRGAVVVVAPLLGLFLGVASDAWSDDISLWSAAANAIADAGILRIAATVSSGLLLWYVLQRLLRRRILLRRLRRLLVERPGIDPADPTLSEAAHIAVGPDGVASRTAAVTISIGWAAIKGIDDAGTVLVIKTGRMKGYIIPKRDVSSEQIETLHALVRDGTAR